MFSTGQKKEKLIFVAPEQFTRKASVHAKKNEMRLVKEITEIWLEAINN
jgi:hypothetical protein